MRKPSPNTRARIKVQIYLDDEIAMGPGKRELLDLIEAHGSISAAGRAMGVSYRRAWMLVDTMNRCFREPLVIAGKGGSKGGGAELTSLGKSIQQRFRTLEAALQRSASGDFTYLRRQLRSEGQSRR